MSGSGAQQVRDVVLVGHCGPDAWMLRSFVQSTLPGARVAMVDNWQDLEAQLSSKVLLLVNRVLEYGFDADDGVALIAQLAARPDPPAMMLVSNYADAQAAAVKAGARPGFGKAELGSAQTAQRLRDAAAR